MSGYTRKIDCPRRCKMLEVKVETFDREKSKKY